MVEVPLPALHLDSTLGAAYVGNLVAAVLYGFTNVQTFIYFESYNDGRLLKSLVSFLWILDTLHLILVSHTLYFYSVISFNNPFALAKVTWSIMAQVFVTGVSDATIRGMFAHRVWIVSQRKKILAIAIIIPSFVAVACSIVFPIRGLQIGTYDGLSEISWVLYLAFAGSVAADVSIAAALSFFLARRRTGIRRTDSIIHILIVYSINTGVLTSLCAIAVLVCYATMPGNFIFIAFYFVLPKLFLNSLLATLNAREKIRRTGVGSAGLISIPLNNVASPHSGSRSRSGVNSHPGVLQIQIETSTDQKTDSMHNSREEKLKRPYTSA